MLKFLMALKFTILLAITTAFPVFGQVEFDRLVQGHLNAHQMNQVNFQDSGRSLDLLRATNSFIEENGPERILSSPGGKELLARQKKLRTAFTINTSLSDCGESRRNLGERLIQATANADHCLLYTGIEEEPVYDFSKVIRNINNRQNSFLNEAKKNSYHDVIINSAKTIWEYDRRFNKNQHSRISDYVNEFCNLRNPRICDDIHLYRKLADARRQFEEESSYKESPTITEMTNELNTHINGLNDQLKLISDDESESSILAMEIYKLQYQRALASNAGSLLLTESMVEKVGGIRTLDDLEANDRTWGQAFSGVQKTYYIPEHQAGLVENDLNNAYVELRKETMDGLKEIHEDNKDEDAEDFIKELMKTHPASLGTTLLQHPEMAGLICQYIGEVEDSDAFWSGFKKVAVVGGIVLGTAAALTVVGAGVSAALYSASAAAATGAAATSLAASASTALLIGGVATGVGFVVGAGETALWAFESRRAQDEYNRLRVALMTNTTDEQGAFEAQQALNDHEAAMQSAMISGAFTAVDVLAFTKLARIAGRVAQAGGRTLGKFTGAVNQLVGLMAEHPKVSSLVGKMGRFFKDSDGALGKLVGKLADMKEGVMRNFLLKMSDLSDDQIEAILGRMFTCG